MDPGVLTGAYAELIRLGSLGIAIVILVSTVIYLYKQNQTLVSQCHETALEAVKALNEVAKAINGHTIAMDANSRTLEVRTKATEAVEREVQELGHKVDLNTQRFESVLRETIARVSRSDG
jgi:hypothetical protein